MFLRGFRGRRDSALGFWREGGNSSVRRIGNERGPILEFTRNHSNGIARGVGVTVLLDIAEDGVESVISPGEGAVSILEKARRPAVQLGDFLVCKERLPRQSGRTFQWRRGAAEPDALQIGLRVRKSGKSENRKIKVTHPMAESYHFFLPAGLFPQSMPTITS